ncbi:dTDP-glucose 4,6-dehydratase [Sphingomonas sp. So64.6b]|uniref:dTDP-glucose 4,6-dehydratase n=1 Tax=Sphingomonas sp. So64.6b TaxID=2997354 RepID=UPI001603B629|nr:dTDP-glucose 4,6-dehydratase [Sphingomonas sp. So64.6b]QNA84431.1 dTDP-glucose 4,6-dehydratase [Sphingomonas sp. So64.6b]
MRVISTPPERIVLVTGGAGFIGSAVCRHLIADGRTRVINLDLMTYAASHAALAEIEASPNYRFVQGDIADRRLVADVLATERVDAIMHLAAESHVDRSIDGPAVFIETNITGTFHMLEAALDHWRSLSGAARADFRFHHVSTDEVFGDLPFDDSKFSEDSAYRPSSPYSASKAAADHLVRAWHHTYGLPVVLSNCSNNYGPHQYPEKLIPLTITRAAAGETLPVYGTGANVRDWLHVADHARALDMVMTRGAPGATYVVGGREEHSNIAVVAMICDLIDERMPSSAGRRRSLIRFVEDRAGHDRRYAIDPSRIEQALDWYPEIRFREGLAGTIDWYLAKQVADCEAASAIQS